MTRFLSDSNQLKAAALAAVVTVLSLGRLIESGRPLPVFVPMAFLLMMFSAGAVTAWGRCAQMPGIRTERKTLMRGAAAAAALSLLALPVYLCWLDPLMRGALAASANRELLTLSYPPTPGGRFALLLWAAGFQTLLLVAAPMSVLARLGNRQAVAVLLCVVLRALLAAKQVGAAALPHGAVFVGAAAACTAAGGLVFARFGLAPAMLLGAGLDLRLFFQADLVLE